MLLQHSLPGPGVTEVVLVPDVIQTVRNALPVGLEQPQNEGESVQPHHGGHLQQSVGEGEVAEPRPN